MRERLNKGDCSYPVDAPLNTITCENRFAVVNAFMLKYYGTNVGHSCNDPLQTITTKHRFALVTVAGQQYQIADIGMRMLQPRELFTAQGFDPEYKIDIEFNGKPMTKSAQVRLVGNSVSPPPAIALIQANYQHQDMQGVA